MFKHNLLLIYRNFKRYKTTFLINVTGLSTGLACAILIYLWVVDETSFDKFHEKEQWLYQVMQNFPVADRIFTDEGTPGLLAEALAEEMPEVEETAVAAYARGGRVTKIIIGFNGTYVKASELHVSKNYFNVFSYPLIHGDKEKVLSDKYSAVISHELALKLFHTTANAIGKTVECRRGDLGGSYIISGVFEKPPFNSSMQFDLLLTYDLLYEQNKQVLSNWGNSNPMTYLILKEGTDIAKFNDKIRDFTKSKYKMLNNEDANWIGDLFLQRYSDRYLHNGFENGVQTGGRITYVKLFSIIAAFVLIIACINFMNLSTAKAARRLKEIGVKKAIGATRWSLIIQHLAESLFISFLSLAISILIVGLMLPEFNEITGKHLLLDFNTNLLISLLGIALVTGIVSGSYPALYLSGFRPAIVLKGRLNTSIGDRLVRKGLVTFQFAISIILIVSVLVVYKQIEFIQNKNLGLNKDNIIRFLNEGKILERSDVFLAELKKIPGVINTSTFGEDITDNGSSTTGISWEGKTAGAEVEFANLEVDYDLIKVFGFEMKEGRTFSREFGTEPSKIIFNEAAIAAMGLKDPVGKTIRLWGEERQIIGVVKNFHYESLYEKVKPCFLRLSPDRHNILVKIEGGMEQETLQAIKKLYDAYSGGIQFEYRFVDDDYQVLYATEQRIAVLSQYFAGMTIVISCLGLFGLAAFTSERRIKEISIRKILGSSEFGIVYLLSGEFTKIVCLSALIALPFSYFVARHWLNSFAFRIDLALSFFIGAGAVAMLIAWVTVGIQTVKAARINPVNNLRTE
ncbi:MAG TPA: ABC transporter permease [Chryseolinea sp.]|nr:ABC transporter permease [Chryseolinea sp.]